MRPESDFQDSGPWPRGAGPRHPILVGLVMIVVAAAVGFLLLRNLDAAGGAGLVSPGGVAIAGPNDSAGAPAARPDSPSAPNVSPFRRAHPWAAPPGGRYYYRSDCRAVLARPDLVFFRTEREARAAGFVPARRPEC
ncbi:MAG TPA: hypothetical protein VFG66_13735 [Gemmatimonadales bacterium]|nr:hypothetical protein [Gemmatimonadales bacterium]